MSATLSFSFQMSVIGVLCGRFLDSKIKQTMKNQTWTQTYFQNLLYTSLFEHFQCKSQKNFRIYTKISQNTQILHDHGSQDRALFHL